jgi:hypothetical protein
MKETGIYPFSPQIFIGFTICAGRYAGKSMESKIGSFIEPRPGEVDINEISAIDIKIVTDRSVAERSSCYNENEG